MSKYIKIKKSHWLFFLCILCLPFIGIAQETANSLNYNTPEQYANGTSNLDEIALVELQGEYKGLKLPRMTTAQRDAIKIDEVAISDKEGLVIYNTTTDCINYYNKTRKDWVSLCGEDQPANIAVLDNQCGKVQVLGIYYKNIELGEGNGLLVEVNVSSAGQYEVEGVTDAGYNFSTKGRFPASGVYTLYLKGEGKPTNSYQRDNEGKPIEKGDKVTLYLNGVKSNCEAYVFVDNTPPAFTIVTTETKGKYEYKTDVGEDNYIEATVNVENPGKYIMYTNTVEGVSFKAEGVFAKAGNGQKVILQAEGTANEVGVFPTRIYTNSKFEFGQKEKAYYDGAFYEVKGGAYTILCDSIQTFGIVELNEKFSKKHEIEVLLKVKRPGPIKLKIYNDDDPNNIILFESGDIDLQYDIEGEGGKVVDEIWIELYNVSGVAKTEREIKLKVEGVGYEPTSGVPCDVRFAVSAGPAEFELFGTPRLRGKYRHNPGWLRAYVYYVTPSTIMGEHGTNNFKIEGLKVKVKKEGTVRVKTPTINGVYFMYEGTINDLDVDRVITLKAFGESIKDGPKTDFTYTFNSYSDNVEKKYQKYIPGSWGRPGKLENVQLNVDYVYPPKKILSIGTQSWHPGGDKSSLVWKDGAGPDLVKNNPTNFGINGEIRVDGLEFINESPNILKGRNVNKLYNYLREVDGVFIGGSIYQKDTIAFKWLAREVIERGLPILYAESNDGPTNIFDQSGIGFVERTNNIENQMFDFISRFTPDRDLELVPQFGSHKTGNRVVSSINHPALKVILSDRFMQRYKKIVNGAPTMATSLLGGVDFTNFLEGAIYTSNHLKKVPTGFIPIANFNSDFSARGDDIIKPKKEIDPNTNVWAMAHKEYGVICVFDGYFGGGLTNSIITLFNFSDYPLLVNSKGEPLALYFGNNQVKYPIYNNFFYMNSIYWMIDYSQKHRKKRY